jgi:hypothetical protein
MVGLTRFFHLMNLCEKSAASANVYKDLALFKKDAGICMVKKHLSYKEFRSGWSAGLRPGAMGTVGHV